MSGAAVEASKRAYEYVNVNGQGFPSCCAGCTDVVPCGVESSSLLTYPYPRPMFNLGNYVCGAYSYVIILLKTRL